MTRNNDLQEILRSLVITCDEVEYGFAHVDGNVPPDEVLGIFHEAEGNTVYATIAYFESQGLAYEGPFAKLTIGARTSLELVGLTAVLASKLTEKSISANVVEAFYHDHIFVQYDKRDDAIQALEELKK